MRPPDRIILALDRIGCCARFVRSGALDRIKHMRIRHDTYSRECVFVLWTHGDGACGVQTDDVCKARPCSQRFYLASYANFTVMDINSIGASD